MLLETIFHTPWAKLDVTSGAYPSLATCALQLIFLLCPLLLWRLWSFTIKDWLNPSKPKELPHWIPLLGHVYSFFWSSVELMERGINYTNRTHEPFAIQLPGTKLYIVTRPSDVNDIFNNQTGIDNDHSLREILLAFGVTADGLRRAWHVPQPGDWSYVPNSPWNPQQMCFIKNVQDGYRKHLLTAKTMEKMCQVFVDSLLSSLTTDSISWCLAGEDNTYSLYSVVRHAMVEASAQSMFGSHLHEIEPDIVQDMLNFNDNAWQVVMRYPDFWSRSLVSEPRKRMMATMRQFVERPRSQNNQANSFIQNVLAGMEATELDMHSRSAMMLMIFWAAVSNEYNGIFWLLTHLVYDPPLLEEVKRETEAAWQSGQLNIKYLGDSCPVLDATFNEVLRHKNAAGAMRLIKEKTEIGSPTKKLQPGNMVYIPFHQIHTNEVVWGERCLDFDHTRFLKRKSLARHASFRPFGGGATYCPGRTLAKQEVFSAVAIILHRFDVRLATMGNKVQSQVFPVLNVKTPSLGLNGPVKGMDVIVEMLPRKDD